MRKKLPNRVQIPATLIEELIEHNNNNNNNRNDTGIHQSERICQNNAIMCEKIQEYNAKLKTDYSMDEHLVSLSVLCERLNTNTEMGLSPSQAKQKLYKNGPNILSTTPKTTPEWLRFLKNMFGWFNTILWIGSFLCFMSYAIEKQITDEVPVDNIYLGIALAVVVFISGCFSYFQELKSSNIMSSFKDLMPRYATVIRGGSKHSCSVEELVVGDIIEIKSGDQLPADIRIISSNACKIDISLVNSELKMLSCTSVCTDENPLKSRNLAFFPSNCVSGSARGIVIRTGVNTVMKNRAISTSSLRIKKAMPLSHDINQFINSILCVSLFLGFLFAQTAFTIGYTWEETIVFFIALIVAQVPEGLLPTVTVVLALTAQRMAKKNCLIKNLHAVESLGLTSVICTDKTGTLTQNKMTVSHVWVNDSIIDADTLIRHADGKKADLESLGWTELIRVGCLCNNAEFAGSDTTFHLKRKTIGDATDVGILKYMDMITASGVEKYRQPQPKVFEIPFNSINKYMITVNESQVNNGHWVCMKGAPEVILDRCSTILTLGKEIPLNLLRRKKLNSVVKTLGSFGERVIGVADRLLPFVNYPTNYVFEEENFPTAGLRFIGLISLIDPPRPSVPEAVERCRVAGIKVIMITGEHPSTAIAIARSVGIITGITQEDIAKQVYSNIKNIDSVLVKSYVVTGHNLKYYTTEELDNAIVRYDEIAFVRTTPQQKLLIVESCQRLGFIVAVTDNGVSDSEVLKKADIGIAMGITGSDISKQDADMILLDDNFSSIVTGVEEGRVIFENLKKSICYTLSSKVPEMAPFVLFFMLDIPLALGAITILCIDFGTDMVPAISYAYEQPESNIMNLKPRRPYSDHLVTPQLISMSYGQLGVFMAFAAFFSYFIILWESGFSPLIIFGLRRQWDSKAINDLTDSYAQEWSYNARKTLEYTCHTAFFASVVITKGAALICCKTRRLSIFQQKMKNSVLTFAIFFELLLAIVLSYCPGLDTGIHMYPLKPLWWFCAIPFAIAMIFYHEIRILIVRRRNAGVWFENETYY